MILPMPALTSYDGTTLAYHVEGEGTPVVALPGGPMLDSASFDDLGGLTEHLRLIRLDLRGTGESATPADPGTYRCDRQVDDVEALRVHLGVDTLNLLGHSGGTNLVLSYAARYPERVGSLILVAPSAYAVGIEVTGEDRQGIVELRQGEPWFPAAGAAFDRVRAGQATDDDWAAIAPFFYGRWDDAAQAHYERGEGMRNNEAARIYGSDGAFDPAALRTALSTVDAPVLVLAGEYDLNSPPRVVREIAALFPNATLATQAGAGHASPWFDDPAWFTKTVTAFLPVTPGTAL
jgi:pimeloyl-ACP methyl ester carboxylesterase